MYTIPYKVFHKHGMHMVCRYTRVCGNEFITNNRERGGGGKKVFQYDNYIYSHMIPLIMTCPYHYGNGKGRAHHIKNVFVQVRSNAIYHT